MPDYGKNAPTGERRRAWQAAILLCAMTLAPALSGEPETRKQDDAPKAQAKSKVQKIGDHLYRIGKVKVDALKRQASFPAEVNMQSGLVEVLAATPNGKLHEAVLVADIDPLNLQMGMLLLGAEAGRNPSIKYTPHDPEAKLPVGTICQVEVEWKPPASDSEPGRNGPKTMKRFAEDMVWNDARKRPMKRSGWVFLGSRVDPLGRFEARNYGSLITTFIDPTSILDNPAPTTVDDTLFYANEKVVPPVGTPVTVIVTVPQKAKEKARDEKGQGSKEKK